MIIKAKSLQFNTKKSFEFIDFTDEVKKFIKKSTIKNGLINIFSLHTTVALIINENEPLLLEDFTNHLKKFAPKSVSYNHNDFTRRTVNICEGECKNGHSHCTSLYLPTNLTLNIIDAKLQLGTWQRIFLIELDHDRLRNIQMQVLGE